MKVLVITGSPHHAGTTAALATAFISGAEEAGHTVVRFDAANKNIHPCIGCEKCHSAEKSCVFQDDMAQLNPHLLTADAVVFVSPIYYYGLTAQLKTVIDRFYANNALIQGDKKTMLLLAMGDTTEETATGAITSFRHMADYLEWEDRGVLIAHSCADVNDLNRTNLLERAHLAGQAIGN